MSPLNGLRYEKTVSICDRNKWPNNTIYRLPKTVTPIKYKLRFRSDPNRYKFYGSETILVMINNRTDIIELNSVDLYIDSASFKTRRLRVEVKNIYTCLEKETIILQFYKQLDKGSGNLTINFNGNINNMVTGFYRTNSVSDDQQEMIAVTDFGPTGSRRAFPNWDDPSFKAQLELTVISPKNHFTLTNMNELRRRSHSSQMDEIRFATSPPMATGMMAVVVGKFDYIEQLTEDNEVSVRVFTPEGRQEEGMFALEVTAKMLMFYKYYFNTSYPLLKLDLISISDFPSSMETWGLITFTESQILVNNNTSEEERRGVAIVIAHALAHQWFGNLVWQTYFAKDIQNAIELDSMRNSLPVETRLESSSEIEKQFSAVSYQKSAAIMRMFNGFVGKESFRNGIRLFLTKYSFKSAFASDLWKTFSEIKDIKLKEMAESWAKQKGFPVKERQSDNQRILTLTQERFIPLEKSGNKSNQIWQIPIKITNMFSPYVPSAETVMTTKQMNITVKEVYEGEWVKLNLNYEGFYRVNYPIEMLNKFIPSVEGRSMPAMDRLNVLSDLFAMIQSGRMSTQTGLNFLIHYKNDDNSAVWDYILKLLSKLDLLLSDTNLKEQFWMFGRELLSGLNSKLGWDPKDTEDLRVTKIRPQMLTLLAKFKDKKLYKNAESPVKRDHIIMALTATDQKERVLKETIRFIDSSKIISGRDKTWKFFEKNFEELLRMFGSSTVEMNLLIKNFMEMFPSEDKANEFETFFTNRRIPGFQETVEISLERMKINAKWLNRDIIQIREFLTKHYDQNTKDL
ncbi:unnamed protein product [Medioppia subpectinata]|uniref:Aminopeptidase n=1 Tax=Medioppia subpectinata TaxID=1979941 RepID=A0A7R9KBV5_9ACAR|nr:unnamed protein product [Medioppia subpectinata]CAG2100246.1 unnamed protein product [Medioppia subpectinata]